MIEKICPTCGIKAEGKKAIEKIFGFRKRLSGLINPQSICRVCRSKHGSKMRKKAEKNPIVAKMDMRTLVAKNKLKESRKK